MLVFEQKIGQGKLNKYDVSKKCEKKKSKIRCP